MIVQVFLYCYTSIKLGKKSNPLYSNILILQDNTQKRESVHEY